MRRFVLVSTLIALSICITTAGGYPVFERANPVITIAQARVHEIDGGYRYIQPITIENREAIDIRHLYIEYEFTEEETGRILHHGTVTITNLRPKHSITLLPDYIGSRLQGYTVVVRCHFLWGLQLPF